MTLQQLKYVIHVADKGSINEAARALYISQPSLSKAIKELENEIKIMLFVRTNRGIAVSAEGIRFLGYARQVVQQAELLEEKYLHTGPAKQRFSVSTQHYTFTANAFVELISEFGSEEYEFTLRETETNDVIDDVKTLRSELGIIYLSSFNEVIIKKLLRESDLTFSELFRTKPHIFICRDHPLADRVVVTLEDIVAYPCVTFLQSSNNSFYFAEEILSVLNHKKSIKVSDRAAIVNMLIGVNAYTISTGVFPSYLHGDDIVSVRLNVDEIIRVGVITHRDYTPTRLGEIYMAALRRIAQGIGWS